MMFDLSSALRLRTILCFKNGILYSAPVQVLISFLRVRMQRIMTAFSPDPSVEVSHKGRNKLALV